MAGFDLDKQHSFVLPGGGRGESGRVDFSAGSFCQALPTRLVTMYTWNASPAIDVSYADYDQNHFENRLTADINDITAGSIVLRRQTMRNDLSASWYYFLAGW